MLTVGSKHNIDKYIGSTETGVILKLKYELI